MGLRMKNLIFWGYTEKSDFLGGRGVMKNEFIVGDYLKRGLGLFADSRGGLAKKRVGVDTPVDSC